MADAGGFEPPTARFVAEYSIQLSYASVVYQILIYNITFFANRFRWRTQEDSNLRPLGS